MKYYCYKMRHADSYANFYLKKVGNGRRTREKSNQIGVGQVTPNRIHGARKNRNSNIQARVQARGTQ